MNAKNIRRGAWVVTVLAALALGPGAALAGKSRSSGTRSKKVSPPGSIAQVSVKPLDALSGTVPVEWTYKAGSLVNATSKVHVQVSHDGVKWRTIRAYVPIREGGVEWDTRLIDDSIYMMRLAVANSRVEAITTPIYVDNTAPTVHITRPSEGEILIEDDARVYFSTVVGTVNLEAAVWDSLTGVTDVTWKLDDSRVLGNGTPLRVNLGRYPGRHDLSVTATDRAGNVKTASTVVFAVPGPSNVEEPPEAPAAPATPEPCDLELPDGVCPLPEDPTNGLPDDPSEVPDPTEELPDVPNPVGPPAPPSGDPTTGPPDTGLLPLLDDL